MKRDWSWHHGHSRLAIAIAANQDFVSKQLMFNIMAMEKPREYAVVNQSKHIKSASLNRLVEIAYDQACDKILFLDADMEFPVDAVPRLFSHDQPIVGGLYHLKTYPFSPVAGWNEPDEPSRGHTGDIKRVNGEGKAWKTNYHPLPADQLVEVHWTGIGCLLVDMDVFNKINFPPFFDTWDEKVGDRLRGHDLTFCDAVRDAGYAVYVDSSVDCGHRAEMVVDDLFVRAFHASDIVQTTRDILREREPRRQSEVARVKQYMEVQLGSRDYWDVQWREMRSRRKARWTQPVYDELKALLDPGSRVCELGCGLSLVLRMLKEEHGCIVKGYDFSEQAVRGQRNWGVDADVADITEPMDPGDYDLVLVSHVLEHLEEEEVDRVLDNAKALGATVVVVVPQEKDGYIWKEHKRIYTPAVLEKTLDRHFSEVEFKLIRPQAVKEHTEFEVRHIIAICKGKRKKRRGELMR